MKEISSMIVVLDCNILKSDIFYTKDMDISILVKYLLLNKIFIIIYIIL